MKTFKMISLSILLSFSGLVYADFGATPEPENNSDEAKAIDKTKCDQVKLYPTDEHKETNAGELLYALCINYCNNKCPELETTNKTCTDAFNSFNSLLDATTNKEYFEVEDFDKLCK